MRSLYGMSAGAAEIWVTSGKMSAWLGEVQTKAAAGTGALPTSHPVGFVLESVWKGGGDSELAVQKQGVLNRPPSVV